MTATTFGRDNNNRGLNDKFMKALSTHIALRR